MRRLRAAARLLTLALPVLSEGEGAFAQATPPTATTAAPASPPVQPQPPPADASRPAAEMLRTGARLFNKGMYEPAARFFNAAHKAQASLTESERVVLHVYLGELEKYEKRLFPPHPDPDLIAADTTSQGVARPARPGPSATPPPPPPHARLKATPPVDGGLMPAAALHRGPAPTGPTTPVRPLRTDTTDPKQQGRWMLQQAREQVLLGHFDAAAQIVADVQALRIKWGRLEDSPEKVAKAIASARLRSPALAPPPPDRAIGVPAPFPTTAPPAESDDR